MIPIMKVNYDDGTYASFSWKRGIPGLLIEITNEPLGLPGCSFGLDTVEEITKLRDGLNEALSHYAEISYYDRCEAERKRKANQ